MNIERNIWKPGNVIEGDSNRASNSRLSDQGALIEGFNVAVSTALSNAIANFIHCIILRLLSLQFQISATRGYNSVLMIHRNQMT